MHGEAGGERGRGESTEDERGEWGESAEKEERCRREATSDKRQETGRHSRIARKRVRERELSRTRERQHAREQDTRPAKQEPRPSQDRARELERLRPVPMKTMGDSVAATAESAPPPLAWPSSF
eukprot:1282327-Rhodomonas_salina.1